VEEFEEEEEEEGKEEEEEDEEEEEEEEEQEEVSREPAAAVLSGAAGFAAGADAQSWMRQALAVMEPAARGLHSVTFQLNLSAVMGQGVRVQYGRGCIARVKRVSGGV